MNIATIVQQSGHLRHVVLLIPNCVLKAKAAEPAGGGGQPEVLSKYLQAND